MSEDMRLDRWLWAARFFKTRSLAAGAVDGGKIRLNSVCGVNLDASNLYKAGVRNYCHALGDDGHAVDDHVGNPG